MNKLVLSVLLFLAFNSVSFAQTRDWSISAGLGASMHYFYSFTDFLSGFGEDLDREKSVLTTEVRINKEFDGIFGIGLVYNLDFTTLNQKVGGNDQSYKYSAHIFSVYPYYVISSDYKYHWIAGIQSGKINYTLSSTGIGSPLPKLLSGSGWLVGLRSDADLINSETTIFQLSGGLQLKTSENVRRSKESFSFKSMDAWIRFGVIYYI